MYVSSHSIQNLGVTSRLNQEIILGMIYTYLITVYCWCHGDLDIMCYNADRHLGDQGQYYMN